MGLSPNMIIFGLIAVSFLIIIFLTVFWSKKVNYRSVSQIFYVNTASSVSTGDIVYTIDGVERAPLSLKKGLTYRFVIETPNFPLYFTTSPTGGRGTPGNLFPTLSPVNGAISITVDSYLPNIFYYQCSIQKNMGSTISLVS